MGNGIIVGSTVRKRVRLNASLCITRVMEECP